MTSLVKARAEESLRVFWRKRWDFSIFQRNLRDTMKKGGRGRGRAEERRRSRETGEEKKDRKVEERGKRRRRGEERRGDSLYLLLVGHT